MYNVLCNTYGIIQQITIQYNLVESTRIHVAPFIVKRQASTVIS